MKGKHGAQVSSRLRAEMQQAVAERDQLRRELAEVSKERSKLAEWKANVENEGLPAVMAERARADAAARHTAAAVEAEREYWRGVAADLEWTMRRLFAEAGDARVIDDEGQVALTALYGDRMVDVMTGKPTNRTQRRNTRAPSTMRSHLAAIAELRKRGLMP